MTINKVLLDIIVCPNCKGGLDLIDNKKGLLCDSCHLKFPIRNDIPVLLIDEAIDLRGDSAKITTSLPAKKISVIGGPNKGMIFHLEKGTCKVIGRSMADSNKTSMFNVDLTLTLDESTRNLVQRYLSTYFRKNSKKSKQIEESSLGDFKRTSDIILDDSSVSRLHAMIFYDELGVGILDLVSKNGTYLNGKEVESSLLKKDDTVEIGETKFVLQT